MWTCTNCGVSIPTENPTYPIHCGCGYRDFGDSHRGIISQIEEDQRLAICATCSNYTEGRCSLIELGCKRPFSILIKSVKSICPADKWKNVEQCNCEYHLKCENNNPLYLWAELERRSTCEACSDYFHETCSKNKWCSYSLQEKQKEQNVTCNKWYAEWRPTKDKPEPKKDLLIITVAVGKHFNTIHEFVRGNHEAYASHCGADYVALLNTTQNWWGLEKFRVYEFAKRYRRTLFLDTDAIVLPETPSLFEIVPSGHVAMHDDYEHLPDHEWLTAERTLLSQWLKEPILDFPTVWNTGVVICDTHQAGIWKPPIRKFVPSHCGEQIWVEKQSRIYPFHKLGTEWNTQYWMKDFYERLNEAKIIHFANAGNHHRTKLINGFLQLWKTDGHHS